ncbi:MAG: ATP-dependent Clp protease adaptor ClpS [Candidatus Hydrogenedentota bacterium]|nr:MAG: ATP-dependent Clp protease adaptor ClpS [Candidatus Hydrogenedentota bacterium]
MAEETLLERKSKSKKKVFRPPMYAVYMLNDDYTTMDFVVNILMSVFHHSEQDAFNIMMKVHTQGKALCGVYVKEIAKSKIAKTHRLARERNFPLRCIMEPEKENGAE